MLYEAVLRTSYFNQQCINRWNYNSSGTPAAVSGSFALASAMGFIYDGVPPAPVADTIMAQIVGIVSTSVILEGFEVRAIYDVADFYSSPFPAGAAGGASGTAMSPTAAYGFRTNRVVQNIRRGTKRFVGVSESFVDGGGVITSAMQEALGELATLMSATLTYDDEGNTVTFVPVVVSKQEYEPSSGRTAYRYYPTLTEQLNHIAAGVLWEAYDTQRTQTSRQYGKGS